MSELILKKIDILFKNKKRVLCLIEGSFKDPFLLKTLNFLNQQKELMVFVDKDNLKIKGLKLETKNIDQELKRFKDSFFSKHSKVEAEGEVIKKLENLSLFKNLNFPNSKMLFFEAVFYDRLIFEVFENLENSGFADYFLKKERVEAVLYIGNFRSAKYLSFLNRAKELKLSQVLFPVNIEQNQIALSLSKNLGDMVCLPKTIEDNQNDKNVFYYPVLKRAKARIGGKKVQGKALYPGPVILIPFTLKYRWEVRELIKVVQKIKEKKNLSGSMVIKCRDKKSSFNGRISEIDFCKEYLQKVIDNDKKIFLVAEELKALEAVSMADLILCPYKISLVKMAEELGKEMAVIRYPRLQKAIIKQKLENIYG